MCSNQELWGGQIILIGHSFGGLVIKSLVVKVGKRRLAATKNDFERRTKMNCTRFLKNLSGIVFYSVPHSGATPKFRDYYMERYRRINSNTKDVAKSGFWANVDVFNRQMSELAVAFEDFIESDLITYAFLETQPINKKWVSIPRNLLVTVFNQTQQQFGNC
jgi:hypothetical protein